MEKQDDNIPMDGMNLHSDDSTANTVEIVSNRGHNQERGHAKFCMNIFERVPHCANAKFSSVHTKRFKRERQGQRNKLN